MIYAARCAGISTLSDKTQCTALGYRRHTQNTVLSENLFPRAKECHNICRRKQYELPERHICILKVES